MLKTLEGGSMLESVPEDKYHVASEERAGRYATGKSIPGAKEIRVALIKSPPYAGTVATGVVVSTTAHPCPIMLPVFEVQHIGDDGDNERVPTDYLDLPSLCALETTCLSEGLAEGIGHYCRDRALSQMQHVKSVMGVTDSVSRTPTGGRKQQSETPHGYPARVVGKDVFDWSDPKYLPKEYNAPVLVSDPKPEWADEQVVPSAEIGGRLIFDKGESTTVAAVCELDSTTDRYRNPWGQTGVSGRGLLGCWGPNHAADNIVTREVKDKVVEVLLVRKNVGDSSTFAFPAGMVEPGQTVSQTLKAELIQEAVKDDSDSQESFVNRLFSPECDRGSVYKGQVDDYRNTDHAWMVTTAQWFHATKEVGEGLCVAVADKDEIASAAWYKIDDVTKMYASHMDWLNLVKARLESNAHCEERAGRKRNRE